jgi:hypothetical protein
MFVAINNTDMDINAVEKWIKTARDNNGGVISPEDAMEVLSKTNHLGHIKKVLRNIKQKCTTPEEIAPYREFILSCVDEREMSGEAYQILREMAKLCGCGEELETINNKKPKFYDKTDCNNAIVVKSRKEFDALRGENLKVYFDADKVYLRKYDLSKVKGLKFKEWADVDLYETKNLPEVLDVSQCSKVDLSYAENLPKDLDFSKCLFVGLKKCDLSNVRELIFGEGAQVDLSYTENLPKDLDVSMCSFVDFTCCDLRGLNLKFGKGAEIDLYEAKNLPEVLDFSPCSKVSLLRCDLSSVEKIKFRDKYQKEEFMVGTGDFSGEVVYEKTLFSRMKKRLGVGGAEM